MQKKITIRLCAARGETLGECDLLVWLPADFVIQVENAGVFHHTEILMDDEPARVTDVKISLPQSFLQVGTRVQIFNMKWSLL